MRNVCLQSRRGLWHGWMLSRSQQKDHVRGRKEFCMKSTQSVGAECFWKEGREVQKEIQFILRKNVRRPNWVSRLRHEEGS